MDIANNRPLRGLIHGDSLIRDAFYMAEEAHSEQLQVSGEYYLSHPIEVASLYSRALPKDSLGIAVCLIHDVVEESWISLKDIERIFGRQGKKVVFMVSALSKRPLDQFKCRDQQLEEYYRRFFSASLENGRIPVIKLLDRLHNVLTIEALEPERAFRILTVTIEFLVPFFSFLNLPLTYELNAICMHKIGSTRASLKHED
jgi:GTP pyrophosphokinase